MNDENTIRWNFIKLDTGTEDRIEMEINRDEGITWMTLLMDFGAFLEGAGYLGVREKLEELGIDPAPGL